MSLDLDEAGESYRAHLRLVILRSLNDTPQTGVHQSLLADLIAPFGYEELDVELLVEQLRWLADRFLIATHEIRGKLVAEITDRGAAVAEGKRTEDGIKQPSRRRLSASALEAAARLGTNPVREDK